MKELSFKLHSTVLESDPHVNLNEEGENIMYNVQKFNFKYDWNFVEPHLSEFEVISALNKGMSQFVQNHYDGDFPPWEHDNGLGPCQYVEEQYWTVMALEWLEGCDERAAINKKYENIAKENGFEFKDMWRNNHLPKVEETCRKYDAEVIALKDSFKPKPNTYRWYQCFNAGKYLAPWQKALAERVYPEHNWEIMDLKSDDLQSVPDATVIGIAPDGSRMIFDLLKFEYYSAENILKNVKFKAVTVLPN
jgi:hypothetical protein